MRIRVVVVVEVKADVVVALTPEEFGGVHGRAVLVVAAHRIAVGSRPAIRARAGEVVNPIRLVKDHGGMERHRFA